MPGEVWVNFCKPPPAVARMHLTWQPASCAFSLRQLSLVSHAAILCQQEESPAEMMQNYVQPFMQLLHKLDGEPPHDQIEQAGATHGLAFALRYAGTRT